MSTMPETLTIVRDGGSLEIQSPLRALAKVDACDYDVAGYVLATRLAEVEAQRAAARTELIILTMESNTTIAELEAQLKAEMEEIARIDALLDRRLALDGIDGRVNKIAHALATCAKYEPGRDPHPAKEGKPDA